MKQWLRKYFTNYKELQTSGGQAQPRMLLYCIQGQVLGHWKQQEVPLTQGSPLLLLGPSDRP